MDLAVYMAITQILMLPPGSPEVGMFLTETGCVIDVNESGTTIVKKAGKKFILFRSIPADTVPAKIIGELSWEDPGKSIQVSGLRPGNDLVEIPRVKAEDRCLFLRPGSILRPAFSDPILILESN